MASAMDVDDDEVEVPTSSSGKGEKKRFEVKKVSYLIHFPNFFYCNLMLTNESICRLELSD